MKFGASNNTCKNCGYLATDQMGHSVCYLSRFPVNPNSDYCSFGITTENLKVCQGCGTPYVKFHMNPFTIIQIENEYIEVCDNCLQNIH